MLHNVILLPQALPSSRESLEWNLLKILLDQITINGVLLVDREKFIIRQLKGKIREYAPEFLVDTLIETLEILDKPEYNRISVINDWFIDLNPQKRRESFCKIEGSDVIYYKIYAKSFPIKAHLIVTGQGWGVRAFDKFEILPEAPRDQNSSREDTRSNITLGLALISNVFKTINLNSYIFGNKNDDSIKSLVFRPIFHRTDYIEIYDRLIGTGSREGLFNSLPIQSNFRNGLLNIIEIYCASAISLSLRINIFTDLHRTISREDLDIFMISLHQNGLKVLARRADGQSRSLEISLWVQSPDGERMRHNRYLGTSQVVIAFDKGSDVIQDDRIYASDYAVVTNRSKFSQYITSGWFLHIGVDINGKITRK